MNALKEKIKNNEAVHGCWLSVGSAMNAEIMGKAGFDWLLIDLEHGAGTESELPGQLQALSGVPTQAIVRVESGQPKRIQRVLDIGAAGIMFPQLNTSAEVAEALGHMVYPPAGTRGAARMVRATDFGLNANTYFADTRAHLTSMVQIETLESLKHLDEIADLEGTDVLFVGPSDLTFALGIFGQWEHPDYVAALKATVKACKNAGKAAGILLLDSEQYERFYDLGFRVIACGSDASILLTSAKDLASDLKNQQILKEKKSREN